MLASSPSPSSSALRSGIPSTPPPPPPQRSISRSPSHTRSVQYENTSHPVSGSRQFSPHSSRLAVEDLRSALNRHTVESVSPGPSGDLHRGHTGDGQASSEGGKDLTNTTTTDPKPRRPSDPPVAGPPAGDMSSVTSQAPGTTTTPGSNKRGGQDEQSNNMLSVGGPGQSDSDASPSKRLRPTKSDAKLLPKRYDLAETSDIVILISSMLMELIRFNDQIPLQQGRLTRFHSRSPPRISVQDYLQRLTTHATLAPPILLSMVYYIDRLCALYPAFTVSSLTIHRFLIASATVASKGLSDSFWTNKTYARVGGISLNELALLELELLFRVEWRIVPQPEVLDDYYQSLVERCEGYEIEKDAGGSIQKPARR